MPRTGSSSGAPAGRARARPGRTVGPEVGAPFPLSARLFQLATLVSEVPRGGDLLYERKLDGYRALCEIRGDGRVRMISRNGKSFTETFAAIADALAATKGLRGCVVDGEIVAYERGQVSFQAMQRARGGGASGLELFAFDLLAEEGRDVRSLPLRERKARLLARVPREGTVRALDAVGDADRALDEARRLGDEGILAKVADAPYRAGRSASWRKVKLTTQDDFVVVGRTPPTNPEDRLGSLVLATRERPGGPLVFTGRVGTGFDRSERRRLAARLARVRADAPPVEVPAAGRRGVLWSRPEIVVRVSFLGITEDGVLRHPSFRGERLDLDPRDVVRERRR